MSLITVTGKAVLPDSAYQKRKGLTKYAVVHCSDTPAHLEVNAAMIREWHTDQGWLDIGYHHVIRRDGTIEIGRPIWAVGSGVAGYNSESVHVCLVGGRGKNGKGENNFTEKQWSALRYVVAAYVKKYPGALVQGHRDFPDVQKECPAFDARPWWDKNRAEAVKLFEGVKP